MPVVRLNMAAARSVQTFACNFPYKPSLVKIFQYGPKNCHSYCLFPVVPCKIESFLYSISIYKLYIGQELKMSTKIDGLVKLHRKFPTDAYLFRNMAFLSVDMSSMHLDIVLSDSRTLAMSLTASGWALGSVNVTATVSGDFLDLAASLATKQLTLRAFSIYITFPFCVFSQKCCLFLRFHAGKQYSLSSCFIARGVC